MILKSLYKVVYYNFEWNKNNNLITLRNRVNIWNMENLKSLKMF